jgi:hypothetical protein
MSETASWEKEQNEGKEEPDMKKRRQEGRRRRKRMRPPVEVFGVMRQSIPFTGVSLVATHDFERRHGPLESECDCSVDPTIVIVVIVIRCNGQE